MKKVLYLTALGRAYVSNGLEAGAYILRRGRLRSELGLKDTYILVSTLWRLLLEKFFSLLIEAMREGVKKTPEGLHCACAARIYDKAAAGALK